MDFYGGIVLLPYSKIFEKTLQWPVKGTYWIRNDSQSANVTRYRCMFNLDYNNFLEFMMFYKIYI